MAIAFPGAEGFGTDTRGAFGGPIPPVVLKVTNLNGTGPGSLRAALATAAPRIVVFEVSGTIVHLTPIFLIQPYVTIAFHTSPGGICLAGEEFRVQTHDVIMFFPRIRTGDHINPIDGWDNRDAMNFGAPGIPAHHCVIKNGSFSWSVDECVTVWYQSHDISLIDCLIGEPLHSPLHPKGKHSMSLLISDASRDVTVLRTLLFAGDQRNPRLAGTKGLVQIVNCASVDWGLLPMVMANHVVGNVVQTIENVDLIGHTFLPGPDSDRLPLPTGVAVESTVTTLNLYIAGCSDPTLASPEMDNWQIVRLLGGGQVPEGGNRSFTPHAGPALTIMSAGDARRYIMANVGATKPLRDVVDQRILDRARRPCVRPGAAKLIVEATDDLPQYTPYPLGAWPDLATGAPPPPLDTDGDGIPDAWEIAHGLNPNDPADALQDRGDGYTNLETYLFELAGIE